jgi:PadR family transcriptional regulator
MANASSIGQFEQLVLTAVLSLREEAYGVSIHSRVVELAAPKAVSLGAIYVTLDRLEDKGFITSWLSDPTPERGGRAKRCYQLQALGERVLRQSADSIHRMHEVLSEAWGDRRWKPARIR